MKGKKKITTPKVLFLIYITAGIVCFSLTFFPSIKGQIIFSFFAALLINSLNLISAMLLFRYSMNKSTKIFLISNLGGMVLRMMLMLIIFIISLKTLNIDQYAFIFTFLVFYFISLFGEIIYFHKKQLKNNPV